MNKLFDALIILLFALALPAAAVYQGYRVEKRLEKVEECMILLLEAKIIEEYTKDARTSYR